MEKQKSVLMKTNGKLDSTCSTNGSEISEEESMDAENENSNEHTKGIRLYVRFPKKLPLDEKEFQLKAKSLSTLITSAHKPRQKHARFFYVFFNTTEDRSIALGEIRKTVKINQELKGTVVSIPKAESEKFAERLIARKQQSVENKVTKKLIKRAAKKTQRKKAFTSSFIISNLPNSASLVEIRKLFMNAVDIQLKTAKAKNRQHKTATVTMPTTHDAHIALKQKWILKDKTLLLQFNTERKKRPPKSPEI